MSTSSEDIREQKTKLRLEIKNRLKNMSDVEKLRQTHTISMRVSFVRKFN